MSFCNSCEEKVLAFINELGFMLGHSDLPENNFGYMRGCPESPNCGSPCTVVRDATQEEIEKAMSFARSKGISFYPDKYSIIVFD